MKHLLRLAATVITAVVLAGLLAGCSVSINTGSSTPDTTTLRPPVASGSILPTDPPYTTLPDIIANANYEAYIPVLQGTLSDFAEYASEYLTYSLFDINGDGIKELFIKRGTCEADYEWEVYTITNGERDLIGSFGGSHSTLYNCKEGGISSLEGHQGVETITQITYEYGQIVENVIFEKQLEEGEDYYYPEEGPLEWAYINDYSLLNKG
ncbi:MAG: hypothetical protein FWD16_01340 [Clostridia bacterium]|nr:hypothetical protein [Clostridia bacterium]